MRDDHYTPFEGKRVDAPVPMRVIRRFRKPSHVAEIRERKVTTFRALEWLLFVDGSLLESRMYHGARLRAYPDEIDECCASMRKDGWVEDPTARIEAQ
jgi:hypothetical protein